MKNEQGFTLIEMLVVLFIISILILVTIPNVTKHFASIDKKGCDAYISMVQAQVEAYKVEHLTYPTKEQLVASNYVKETEDGMLKCPNGNPVSINETTGEVKEQNSPTNSGNANEE